MSVSSFRRQVSHFFTSLPSSTLSRFSLPIRTMATKTHPDREILPTNVIPRHYRLSLIPDFSTFKYAGHVSVQLDVTKPTSSIVLNALELEFHSASVQAGGKTMKAKKIDVNDDEQIATLDFGEEVTQEATLKIDFTGILNDKMAGFYRTSYIDAKSGEKKWLATTQMGISPLPVHAN